MSAQQGFPRMLYCVYKVYSLVRHRILLQCLPVQINYEQVKYIFLISTQQSCPARHKENVMGNLKAKPVDSLDSTLDIKGKKAPMLKPKIAQQMIMEHTPWRNVMTTPLIPSSAIQSLITSIPCLRHFYRSIQGVPPVCTTLQRSTMWKDGTAHKHVLHLQVLLRNLVFLS